MPRWGGSPVSPGSLQPGLGSGGAHTAGSQSCPSAAGGQEGGLLRTERGGGGQTAGSEGGARPAGHREGEHHPGREGRWGAGGASSGSTLPGAGEVASMGPFIPKMQ